MSTNWKQIGKTNRNSNSNEITFSKIISNVGNKIQKGVIFDISGDNLSFGIGTSNPFSRLSFGEITNNGVVNTEKPGQLSAIALNETSTGNNFKGIIYNTDVKSFNRGGSKTNALQLLNINGDFSVDNSNNGMFYVTEENVTVIGGNPTEGNEVNINKGIIDAKGIKIDEDNGSGGNTKIVLDVKGSLRTNGYINFYNKIEGTDTSRDSFEPELNFWNDSNTRRYENIPHGSLWLRPAGNGYPSGLYFKNESGNAILISGQSGESQLTTASNFFDGSLEAEPKFIIQRSSITGQVGGTPIVFSGNSETKTTDINAYKNLVTITSGNLSVCASDGSNNAIVMDISNPIYDSTDPSGGIIWCQKQLLMGNKKSRRGWGTIDINIKQHSPALLSYPLNPLDETEYYKPEKATNSLLLLTKMLDEQTHKIGTIYDVSASIIIGGRFRQIDTPSSIISNELTSSTGNKIVEKIGNNIMFGRNNDLSGVPFSFVLGADNEIKNINTAVSAVHGGGSLVIGKSNSLKYDKPEFNSHFILGDLNNSFSSKNSFIQGTNNNNYGEYNFIFGNNNTLAIDNETLKENNNDYSVNYSFCVGQDNKIRAPFSKNIHNAILIGKDIQLDLSHNTFMNDIDKSYVLLGSKASIKQNTNPDIRFAFGTKEKDGNVFTIDMSGNTRIYGNLVVDGSRVVLNTEVLDVSDNNISLNIGGNDESAIGGGITLVGPSAAIKWNNDGKPSNNYWDTSGADISTNNIYVNELNVNGGIVIDDLSLNDISANHFYTQDGKVDINGTKSILTDISANDASFNTISTIGNVGIGINDPDEALVVKGEGDTYIKIVTGKKDKRAGIQFVHNDISTDYGGDGYIDWRIQTGSLGSFDDHASKESLFFSSNRTPGSTPENTHIYPYAMVISYDGNVGIGIDVPDNKLEVDGDISANAVYANDISANDISANHFYTRDGNVDINGTKSIFTDISANDANFNTINTIGKVGIGVRDPSDSLHTTGNIRLKQHGYIWANGTGNLNPLRNDHTGSLTLRAGGNGLVDNEPWGWDSTAGGQFILGGDWNNGYIKYIHKNITKFLVNHSGNVGIGNEATNPQSLLHLYKNTDDIVIEDISYSNVLRLTSQYVNGGIHKRGPLITFTNKITGNPGSSNAGNLNSVTGAGSSEFYISAIGSHQRDNDLFGGSLSFYTKPPGDDLVYNKELIERMTITHEGKVGIGITDPNFKLAVDGDISANAAVYANDISANDISANHFYTRDGNVDINGTKSIFTDISANDASFNTVHLNGNVFATHGDVSIGTADMPIKDLYLSSDSLYIGVKDGGNKGHKITIKDGQMKFQKFKRKEVNGEIKEVEDTEEPGINSFNDISANDINANDISANDVYVNSIRMKDTGHKLSIYDLSGVESGSGLSGQILALNDEGLFEFQTPANGSVITSDTTLTIKDLSGSDIRGIHFYTLDGNVDINGTKSVFTDINLNGDISLKNKIKFENKYGIIEAEDNHHAIYMRNSYANISSQDPPPQDKVDTMDFYEFGDIRFFTGGAINSTSSKERMCIQQGGNVGIGANNPKAMLDISGLAVEDYLSNSIRMNTTGGKSFVRIGRTGFGPDEDFSITKNLIRYSDGYYRDDDNTGVQELGFGRDGSFKITANPSGTGIISTNTRLYIKYNGNVGIGTTTPNTLLHVPATDAYTSGITVSSSDVRMIMGNVGGDNTGGSIQVFSGITPDSAVATTSSTKYDLLLNPLGGNVGIGIDKPYLALDVSGDKIGRCLTNDSVSNSVHGTKHRNSFRIGRFDGNNAVNFCGLELKVDTASNLGMASGVQNNQSAIIFKAWGHSQHDLGTEARECMRIRSDGNVGIGTDDPDAILDVSGIIKLSGSGLTTPTYACIYNQDNIGPTISGYKVRINTGMSTPTEAVTIDDNGNVTIHKSGGKFLGNLSGNATSVTNGVYTTSSVTALSDVTSVGSGAIITSSERTNIATNTTNIATNTANIGTKLPLSGGTLTGNLVVGSTTFSGRDIRSSHSSGLVIEDTEKQVTITPNKGWCVIGADNKNPESNYPLTVKGYGYSNSNEKMPISQGTDYHYYFKTYTTGIHNGSTWYFPMYDYSTIWGGRSQPTLSELNIGLRVEQAAYVKNMAFGSDKRIKENIRDVSDNDSLQKLRDISCVYYEYKDKISRGFNTTIGFIAQQVRENMPIAVGMTTNIIPNEMRDTTNPEWVVIPPSPDASGNIDPSANNTYKLTISDLSDNSGNTLYRFYVSNDPSGNDECQKEIYSLENDAKSFIFDQSWNNVFIYGKEVKDFHILDKNKLFSLNFSATQEIDRIQQSEKTKLEEAELKIATLEAENAILKTQIADILSRLQTLENA